MLHTHIHLREVHEALIQRKKHHFGHRRENVYM